MTYTYRLEKLPTEPIVINQMGADFSMAEHTESSSLEVMAILEAADQPLFVIFDVTEANFSFDDVIAGASQGTRSSRPLLRHPNMRQMVVVSHSQLVKLAAMGLSAPIFGGVNVKVFDTLEDALAHCRTQFAIRT